MDRSEFYEGRVSIDGFPATGIPCILQYDKSWNGWVRPCFEYDAIENIRNLCLCAEGVGETDYLSSDGTLLADLIEYDKETDSVLCYPQGSYLAENQWIEKWTGHDMDFGGGDIRHIYEIGSGSWIWSEI